MPRKKHVAMRAVLAIYLYYNLRWCILTANDEECRKRVHLRRHIRLVRDRALLERKIKGEI